MGVTFKDGKLGYDIGGESDGVSASLGKAAGVLAVTSTVAVGSVALGGSAGATVAAATGVGAISYAVTSTTDDTNVDRISHNTADTTGGVSAEEYIQSTTSSGTDGQYTRSTTAQDYEAISQLMSNVGLVYDGDVAESPTQSGCAPQFAARRGHGGPGGPG